MQHRACLEKETRRLRSLLIGLFNQHSLHAASIVNKTNLRKIIETVHKTFNC